MRPAARRRGAAPIWLLVLMVLAGAAWWVWQIVVASTGKGTATDAGPGNLVVMKNVVIEGFDEGFRQNTVLRGQTATTFKDSSDLILEPCEGTILRDRDQNVFVCAQKAHKQQAHDGDTLLFTGNVDVATEGRRLRSEKLTYVPATKLLESGAPVTILSTGSLALGKHLRSQTDLKNGLLEGDVQITSFGEGQRSAEELLRISGNKSDFDLVRGLYDVVGNAWARRADQDVRGLKMTYNRKRGTLTADGDVVARRPDVTLTCGHLEYYVEREHGVATANPKAVQMTPATTSEDESMTELTARTLELDFRRQVLEGKDEVMLKRSVRFEGDWDPDYRINANQVTSLYGKRRSTFLGDVKIESGKMGAIGDRAVFYQTSAKLYILGHAEAWDYAEDKTRMNHIAGEKIIHNLKTGKSVVLDGVKYEGRDMGSSHSRPRGDAPEAPPSRPGRVQIVIPDGGAPEVER